MEFTSIAQRIDPPIASLDCSPWLLGILTMKFASVPDDSEDHTCSPLSNYVLNVLEDLQEHRFVASEQLEFTADKCQQQKKENPESM